VTTPIHDQFRAERDELGEALLTALRDGLPWGTEIDLGMGRTATLERVGESRVRRQPIYAPSDEPSIRAEHNEIVGHGPWRFMFDFRLTNCDQDHIEVTVEITGGGGFV
jgi:hypothetical protein